MRNLKNNIQVKKKFIETSGLKLLLGSNNDTFYIQ